MSLPEVPENLQNIPVVREYLASLVAELILQLATDTGDLLADGSVPMTGLLNMSGFRIMDLGFPIDPTDAATKEYVDIAVNNGGSGSGATSIGRAKDFVTHQSGDLTVPGGTIPGVISGTTYTLVLDIAGKVTFTVSGVFGGAGTTPSAQFGLKIDGVNYIFAHITEANIGGTFATGETPMGGVVGVTLTDGSHTIDWIGCSTNGAPKIRASSNVYATMDVDYPSLVAGGGGGGINMADSMLLKPFFAEAGLPIPSNTLFENLYTFPTVDFQNLNGGSFDTQMSRQEFVPVGAGPVNFGFDIGAPKSTILFLLGMLRVGTVSLDGIFLSSALPVTEEIPDGSYLFFADSVSQKFQIYKKVGGVYTELAHEVDIAPGGTLSEVSMALAVYYDDTTDRLVFLGRFGSECWFPIIDTTDASFTTMRYVGLRYNWNSGSQVQWAGCPVAIYYD